MVLSYQSAKFPETREVFNTGWLPPILDYRDYSPDAEPIAEMAKTLRIPAGKTLKALPTKVDLRQYCSPVEDQLGLGSCTANAAVGIVEYFERRAFGKHINGSRLFVYKTTRNLMGVTGDTGAWCRTAMGSLAHCGVPNEKYWPYTDREVPGPNNLRTFDDEPPAFVYALADNYEALKYFCHDPLGANISRNTVLKTVKIFIAAKIPSMFGFWGFDSAGSTNVPGDIPFPCPNESIQWGHAVAAVGYNDNKIITNTRCNKKTKGALLFRNSWGYNWGENGYGWLPYDYVLKNLALDFWSLLGMGWLDTKNFGF